MEKYCIVDVETTGANRQGQKITEIAIIITDGINIISEYSTLVNPERRIPTRITYLTGITNEMVSTAPKFYEIAKKVIEITEDCTFVAHNVFFDYQFVQREFSDLGYNFRRKLFCTVKNSRIAFPGLRSYSLKNLSAHFNIELKNHHRALSDTKAAYELFKKINEKIHSPLIQKKPTPSKLEEKTYKELPELGGVYYLYDGQGELLYIGKSKNIKNRVNAHFRLDMKRRKDIELKGQIAHIDYKIYPHDLVSQIVESMEIKKYRPPYNVALRRNRYRYEVVLSLGHDKYYYLHHQATRGKGVPSKSRRHSERIIVNLLNKSFGTTNSLQFKNLIPIEDYNERLKKVYRYYFYNSPNFTREISLNKSSIHFFVNDNKLTEIKYDDHVIKVKEDPDIKKIFISYFAKN